MPEKHSYLSQILGEQALQINIFGTGHVLYGEYNHKQTIPLKDVQQRNNNVFALTVEEEHLAGHFSGPQTMPAYRMLELGSMVGGKVQQIQNAQFNRIVTIGDNLKAFKNADQTIITREIDNNIQEVATASIQFGDEGLTPCEIGTILEASAQTLVANIANRHPQQDKLLYPLILNVGRIDMKNSSLTQYINVQPTMLSDVDERNRFSGSAQVISDGNVLIANVEDIKFQLATEEEIRIFNAMGRNY